MFKGGEVADIKVGAAPKTALSSWISKRGGLIRRTQSDNAKPGLAGLFFA